MSTHNPKEASMATTEHDVLSWRGQNLIDSHGDKIGKIEEIYLDADSNVPEWALVTTGHVRHQAVLRPDPGRHAR